LAKAIPAPRARLCDVEAQIHQYLKCWEASEKRFINFPEELRFRNYMQEIFTPCEQQYLIIARFPMPDLEYDAFRKMPILLLDTQRYQVNHDHFFYWAFASDVYDFFKNEIASIYDNEISSRYHLLMDAILFYSHNPNRTFERDRIAEATQVLLPRVLEIQSNSFIIAAHLAYPLLEGIGRRIASSLVEKDGAIKEKIANFTSADGEDVQISGRSINRLNALLRVIETKAAGDDLRSDLADYRTHFEKVYSKHFDDKKTYDIIDDQRNSLLHGEAYWQIFYAAMINLICVLLTSSIQSTLYNSKYPELIRSLDMSQSMPRFRSRYYPPI
jgi:hypothetical protein